MFKKCALVFTLALALLGLASGAEVQAGDPTVDELVEMELAQSSDNAALVELTEAQVRSYLLSRGVSAQEAERLIQQPKIMLQQMGRPGRGQVANQVTTVRVMNISCSNGAEALFFSGPGSVNGKFTAYGTGATLSSMYATCGTGGSYCSYLHTDANPRRSYQDHPVTGYNPQGYYWAQCRP